MPRTPRTAPTGKPQVSPLPALRSWWPHVREAISVLSDIGSATACVIIAGELVHLWDLL